jgi:tetratricopeptide (TPR) repeat protein
MHYCWRIFFLLVLAAPLNAQDVSSEREAKADTLLMEESYEEALAIYNQLLAKNSPQDDRFYNLLYKRAVCQYSLEDFSDALADADRVVEKFPSFSQARLLRAFINRELDNVQEQLRDLEVLLGQDPLNLQLVKWQASLLIQDEKYERARERLAVARSIEADEETELYLGLTYYYTDQNDSAIMYFDKAIELNKGYLPAYLYAGTLALEESAYELALHYMDSALTVDPGNSSALLYKGVALTELKREEEGCRCLSEAFYSGEDDASGYLKEYCFR